MQSLCIKYGSCHPELVEGCLIGCLYAWFDKLTMTFEYYAGVYKQTLWNSTSNKLLTIPL